MTTVLLDVDGVIANCATPVHAAAQRIIGRKLPGPDQWHDFEFGPSMCLTTDEADRLHCLLQHENRLGWQIDLYPGAAEFVKKLQGLAEVVFVTAHWSGMPCWVPARDRLLQAHFGRDVEIIYTHHKWRVRGDLLIDDKPSTIARNRHRGLLFSRPWNRSTTGLRRVENYEQILEYV